ncbi:10608_t:CDS:2, partial [Paraglomus brasilianum]
MVNAATSNIKSRFTHCQEEEESTRTIEDEQILENDSNDTTTDSEDENDKKHYNDETALVHNILQDMVKASTAEKTVSEHFARS